MNRRQFLSLGLTAALVAGISTGLHSRALAEAKPAVFTGLVAGVGAGGYDVVSYFDGEARAGDAALTAEHDGVTYRFSSAANRERFLADPKRHLPQYGGYCAYAVSQGYTAKIDPEAWSVVDGKLYLNYSKRVRSTWEKDIAGHIRSANENWPSVLTK